mgnify:CR=1 FL=1
MNDDIGWGPAERQQVAFDLQDNTIQIIVGNLLRFKALRNLLDKGRTEEAADLLQWSMATQRGTLGDLPTLTTRINPVA